MSGKQWNFVLKGARKVGRAITGGKAALETKDGARVIRMGRNLRGGYSQSTKHGAAISDAVTGAYNTFREGFHAARNAGALPTLARHVAFSGIGAGVGVHSIKKEQEHIDIKRAAEGKGPRSKGLKRAELAIGGLGSAITGLTISSRAGKLYKVGQRVAAEARTGKAGKMVDAFAKTGLVGVGAASGGILAHEQAKKTELKGSKHRGFRVLKTIEGATAGGIGAITTHTLLKSGASTLRTAIPLAKKGDLLSIGKIGAIGAGAAGGTALGVHYARKSKHRSTAKKVAVGAQAAITGTAVGSGVAHLSNMVEHAMAGQFTRPTVKNTFNTAKKAAAGRAKKAKGAYTSFMSRKFPKKPKALIGMYGGE